MAKPDPDVSSHSRPAEERTIYLCPGMHAPNEDIELRAIWNALFRDRWILIVLSLLGLVAGATCAWLAPSWYRAEVRLLPEGSGGGSPLGSQVGDLTGLAGAIWGVNAKSEPLAILRSNDFARGFLVDEGLVNAISDLVGAQLDAETAAGVLAGLTSVREDQQTGTVTLAIDWKDPATAADVANRLAARINRVSRERAISEATANIGFLRGQMAEAQDASLRDVTGKLLELELRKLVVAKGRADFAFHILDPARPPGGSYRPNRRVVTAAGLVGGFMLALAIVFVRSVSRRSGK